MFLAGARASRIAPDGVAYNAVLLATSRGEASASESVVQAVQSVRAEPTCSEGVFVAQAGHRSLLVAGQGAMIVKQHHSRHVHLRGRTQAVQAFCDRGPWKPDINRH